MAGGTGMGMFGGGRVGWVIWPVGGDVAVVLGTGGGGGWSATGGGWSATGSGALGVAGVLGDEDGDMSASGRMAQWWNSQN